MSKQIFVFDGAFGFTKRHLEEYTYSHSQLKTTGLKPGLVKKCTMIGEGPQLRDEISVDLKELTALEFNAMKASPACYFYTLTGQAYAFLKESIENDLGQFQKLFLVVRDLATICQLRRDFPGRMTSVYVHMDAAQLKADMNGRFEPDQLTYHLERHQEAWADYVRRKDLYDDVLINKGHSNDIHRQLDGILRRNAAVLSEAPREG